MQTVDREEARVRVRVWDLPLRLFHGLLIMTVGAAFVTGHLGGNAMEWHVRFGLLAMGLLLFRWGWAVFGSRWARLAQFTYGPAAVLRYLRGAAREGDHFDVGHSPVGSLSVWALLGLTSVQVVSGLFADDEISTAGPLSSWAPGAWVKWATSLHTEVFQQALVVLIALHVVAVLVYRFRRGRDLVTPMVTGDKWLAADALAANDGWWTRVRALLWAVVCVLIVSWVARQGG